MEQEFAPPADEIQRHISAAFDSVGLINRIVSGTEQIRMRRMSPSKVVEANVGHLNIMLAKNWFADALTEQQRDDIDSSIAAGNQFIVENPITEQ
jgi:hypothetical protein